MPRPSNLKQAQRINKTVQSNQNRQSNQKKRSNQKSKSRLSTQIQHAKNLNSQWQMTPEQIEACINKFNQNGRTL